MPGTYRSDLSFYGALHWQLENGTTSPHPLSATYIEDAVTALDSGWIYCSVGDTYSGRKPIGLGVDDATARLVGLKFWFACYGEGSKGTPPYRYDLCVYDDQQRSPFPFYALDTSRNGYVAVYTGMIPDYHSGRRSARWGLQGLNPGALKEGMEVRDLRLISPRGKPVRRLMEDYFPYLNEHKGHDALFTLRLADDGLRRPW